MTRGADLGRWSILILLCIGVAGAARHTCAGDVSMDESGMRRSADQHLHAGHMSHGITGKFRGPGGTTGDMASANMSQGRSESATEKDDFPSAAIRDFNRRCASPAVIKCVGFDDAAAIDGRTAPNSGIRVGAAKPALDSAIKASGRSSLKFTIPTNSGPDTSGSYFTNFSDELSLQFGGNDEFFVQWRQRFSAELLSTRYEGGRGWKVAIVGTGDQPKKRYGSCTALEVVLNAYYENGFPVLYNSCTGSTSHGAYDGFYAPIAGADYKLQNARPSPYCLSSQQRTSFFPPVGNCFGFVADEWMTFQLRIKTGPRVKDEFVGSYVTLWIARENRPSELVVDWGPYGLSAGDPADNQRFGKIWLLPYHTGKSASQVHATAYTWYDELIISRAKISDPLSARPTVRVSKTVARSSRLD